MNSLNKISLTQDYILFAQVGRPHGLQGAFFLKTEDRRTRWDGYKTLLIEMSDNFVERKVLKSYLSGNALVLQLEGINSREAVEPLYHKKIYVHKNEIKIEENEYLVSNLKGYKVVTNTLGTYQEIGTVIAFVSFGAQENIEIKMIKNQDSVFYPFIPPFIQKVDEEKKVIEVIYIPEFFDEVP